VFTDVPAGVIISPNAEHHGFSNSESHICSPGSNFASDSIDQTGNSGSPAGFGGAWQEAFEGMLSHLEYSDAGGITINHPTWFSRLTDEEVFEMLDFDDRVLGIEIYNDYTARNKRLKEHGCGAFVESQVGYSLNMWDRILSSGRRCWGFCVPDHSAEPTWGVGEEKIIPQTGNWRGRNILLVPAFTDHECLEAYRDGRFYGCLLDNGLTVTDFTVAGSSIAVSTNKPARIIFITDAASPVMMTGTSATYELPTKQGVPDLQYVRIEIEDDSGERLFLQPLMCDAG